MTTRRDFLKYALLSGTAGLAGSLPESIRRAHAIAPEPGSTFMDAEHVVILMQENRSFDHMFGTLQGVRGFNDPRAMTQANGNPVFLQGSASGETYGPWRLNMQDSCITWMGSIPHSRDSQVDAWNGGRHDRWVDVKRSHHKAFAHFPLTMGYHTREDLPFYYALADAFTICDQNYCGAMTSTTPNRLIFWSGTVRDRQEPGSAVYMRNPEILQGGMTWTSFPQRLSEAGIGWKFYQNELSQTGGMEGEERAWLSNFGCNVLECFDAYSVSHNPGYGLWVDECIAACRRNIEKLERSEMLVSERRDEELAEAQALLAVLQERRMRANSAAPLSPAEQALFDRAFVTNRGDTDYRALEVLELSEGDRATSMKAPKGDMLYQFRKDVREGRLPTVSWLAAPERFSAHPTSPWYGAWYVSEIMDILTENPEVWKKTIFILTYDENDGFFDHGCSYVAADPARPETGGSSASIRNAGLEYTTAADEQARGVPQRLARSGPVGLGFRVPTIVASPWSRGGWVNSQVFDHSSSLRFLEVFLSRKFGKPVAEPNISDWRRAVSGDLTSCFRPFEATAPHLAFLDRDRHLEDIHRAKSRPYPEGYHAFTPAEIADLRGAGTAPGGIAAQERGTRPSCALPYELTCDMQPAPDGASVVLNLAASRTLHGAAAAGAAFNIYRRGLRDPAMADGFSAATWAVAAGDRMRLDYPSADFVDGLHTVEVLGPNGFYRQYRGQSGRTTLAVACHARTAAAGQASLLLALVNHGHEQAMLSLGGHTGGSRRVTLAPGQARTVTFDLAPSANWYDVTLTAEQDSTFFCHLAGRVETGRPGLTDPVMGGVV
ncbi:MAG: phospholipase C, phosphocholine-specific [Acetobacter sp.]|uniref:phosphocholine-specific phospholipase C n=1 Tax=Acetobacter sp. TaxID=440 RepID=UPI0039ED51D0